MRCEPYFLKINKYFCSPGDEHAMVLRYLKTNNAHDTFLNKWTTTVGY